MIYSGFALLHSSNFGQIPRTQALSKSKAYRAQMQLLGVVYA